MNNLSPQLFPERPIVAGPNFLADSTANSTSGEFTLVALANTTSPGSVVASIRRAKISFLRFLIGLFGLWVCADLALGPYKSPEVQESRTATGELRYIVEYE